MKLAMRLSLGILVAGLVMSGCRFVSPSRVNNQSSQTNQLVDQPNPAVEQAYRQDLARVLQAYWQDNKVEGLQAEILELRAPAKYFELHLELVIIFELFDQGRADQDQEKIEQALAKLDRLQQDYSWINTYGKN